MQFSINELPHSKACHNPYWCGGSGGGENLSDDPCWDCIEFLWEKAVQFLELQEHQHDWKRTGQYFPTNDPIYIVVCKCGAAGKQYAGGYVDIKQLSGCEELEGAKEALNDLNQTSK